MELDVESFKNLRIAFEKLVNNLSKQGADVSNLEDFVNNLSGDKPYDINNLQLLLHKMNHTRDNYADIQFSADEIKLLQDFANTDLAAGNADLEMYLSWLKSDDKFSEHKKR